MAADWRGEGIPIATIYRAMATRQLRGSSPSYERLCLGIADDPAVIERLETLPEPKRQPNLLLGAVRFLAGPVDDYPAFRAFVLTRWADVARTMAERRTQTNEPGRCATLLPVLAGLPQPLALIEVGASAGLCLYPDRYSYRFVQDGVTTVLGDSPVVLQCAVSAGIDVPAARPQVVWRAGLDLNPLDVRDADDARWLRSLIWPEHAHRFETLRAATAVARAEPPDVRAGDLVDDLPGLVAGLPDGATPVVFHSAVLAYVPAPRRAEFVALVQRLRGERGVVWVSNDGPGVVVPAPAEPPPDGPMPFALAVDGHPVAYTDPHGRAIRAYPDR